MANSAVRELVVPKSNDQVFSAAFAVLSDAEAVSIVSADEALGEIAADVDRSGKSFGERLDVSVEPSGAAETSLWLRSKSSRRTLWDWGKNRENVEWLVEAITAHLQI